VQASLGTSGGLGNSTPLEGKEPLARGLCYQPPASSLASGRSLSIAVTQEATWKTANEVLGGTRSASAMSKESSALSLPLNMFSGVTRTLSQTSAQSAQMSEKSARISKSILKSASKAQKAQVKNRVTFGIMGCVGCSAISVSHTGPSSMGP
jgi:hypothetical protein